MYRLGVTTSYLFWAWSKVENFWHSATLLMKLHETKAMLCCRLLPTVYLRTHFV